MLPSAAPAQARPDSPCPASAHRQHGATSFPPEGQGGWLAGSGDDAPSSATSPGGGLSPAGSGTASWEWGPGSARAPL